MKPARTLRQDRRGAAALEMALITTFLLLPITGGVIGSGQALLAQYRVDRALHTALVYAWAAPTDPVTAWQAAAVAGYGSGGTTITAQASAACYCINPTDTRASGSVVACTGSCTAPKIVGTWATVTTSTVFTPIFPIPWTSSSWTLSATGTVRVQ